MERKTAIASHVKVSGRVVVIGSINQDIVVRTPRFPYPGETLSGETIAYFQGGKGANQAVAAAKAGAAALMAGCVGTDSAGASIRDELRQRGVDVGPLASVKEPTGTAIVQVDSKGENQIVIIAGANAVLAPKCLTGLVRPGDVVIAQMETGLAATEAVFNQSRKAGAITILNAAPMRRKEAQHLLRTGLVDNLIVNMTELAGLAALKTREASALTQAGSAVAGQYSVNLIVTMGKQGAAWFDKNGKHRRVKGYKIAKVIDTTGAGDCFVGNFAAALAARKNFIQAIAFANAAAALSTLKQGAGSAMPAKNETRKFMRERSR